MSRSSFVFALILLCAVIFFVYLRKNFIAYLIDIYLIYFSFIKKHIEEEVEIYQEKHHISKKEETNE